MDASVVVDWVAPDVDPTNPARRLLRQLAEASASVFAPRLLFEEVANALLTGCRRGRWDGMAADRAYSRLRRAPIEIIDERRDLDRAWELSRRYDEHPVYDMVYVAVTERLGDVLVTQDERLRERLMLAYVVGP
ncbi:MAG: type II toxin-antitoxin system VapC family toxin [Nocardioidaceae bacterium]|nr:type II toxin-antitoxin system VapC family toxin [Nocardioidaceae bacterium]